MADLTITASGVITGGSKNQIKTGYAAESITQAMPLYRVAATGLLAKAANTSAAAADCVGVSLNSALAGQPVTYQTGGPLAIGATVAPGMPYVVSAAGLISPITDHTVGDYLTHLGIATTTTNIDLNIQAGGVAATTDVT